MKNKNKNKNKKDKQVFDEIMFNEAGSMNECTGLIPTGSVDANQYDSFRELQHFDAKSAEDKLFD